MYFSIPTELEHEVRYNNEMLFYLCDIGLDPNEVVPSTGMNTIIALCSEGNAERIDLLFKRYKGLFQFDLHAKTHEGLTALDWGRRYPYTHNITGVVNYPICSLIQSYKNHENKEFKEVMYTAHIDAIKNNQTLCFDGFHVRQFKQIIGSFLIDGLDNF
jgi:hypothetical protein